MTVNSIRIVAVRTDYNRQITARQAQSVWMRHVRCVICILVTFDVNTELGSVDTDISAVHIHITKIQNAALSVDRKIALSCKTEIVPGDDAVGTAEIFPSLAITLTRIGDTVRANKLDDEGKIGHMTGGICGSVCDAAVTVVSEVLNGQVTVVVVGVTVPIFRRREKSSLHTKKPKRNHQNRPMIKTNCFHRHTVNFHSHKSQ